MNRRQAIIGALTAGLLPGAASAATKLPPLFADTPLADNRIAKRFTALPALALPRLSLKGDDGKHAFSELTGKIRIVALWAEWCPPCIAEAGDLARLHAKFAGPDFGIQSILSGSERGLGLAAARQVLAKTGGETLPLWIEPSGGNTLVSTYSPTPQQATNLPCTLILDRAGVVRGRCLGAGFVADQPMDPHDKSKILATRTEWSTPDAEVFVQGLINGALG